MQDAGANVRRGSVGEPFDLLALHSYGTAQSYKQAKAAARSERETW